jgi:hypothetical protein
MKNILVLKHYKLTEMSGWPSEGLWPDDHPLIQTVREQEAERIKRYNNMKSMCCASAEKFILGLDDILIHEAQVDNIQQAFKQHFYDLYDIWAQGHVNILYADLDVLFIKPFDWFEHSDHFVMYTSWNCGVRYHGHDMDPKLWDHAFERCKQRDHTNWQYEQDIYKEMLSDSANWNHYSRNRDLYEKLVINLPESDSLADICNSNETACAVHFHATRGNTQINHMETVFDSLMRD